MIKINRVTTKREDKHSLLCSAQYVSPSPPPPSPASLHQCLASGSWKYSGSDCDEHCEMTDRTAPFHFILHNSEGEGCRSTILGGSKIAPINSVAVVGWPTFRASLEVLTGLERLPLKYCDANADPLALVGYVTPHDRQFNSPFKSFSEQRKTRETCGQ